MAKVEDISGSRFVAFPVSRHDFVESSDGFICKVCRHPRALHASPEAATILSNIDPFTAPIRSDNFFRAAIGKILTDDRIEEYEQRGFYSEAFRDARRAHWNRNKNNKSGNFRTVEGRLIYSP